MSEGNVTLTFPPDGTLLPVVKDIVYVTGSRLASAVAGVALIGATMAPCVTV